ncbi:hypothetical protein HK104_010283 [Borealophlyctis nickersoniae]|nr:hypothetical protein HK104_010283 [Borealophlyctis nickersoniae]
MSTISSSPQPTNLPQQPEFLVVDLTGEENDKPTATTSTFVRAPCLGPKLAHTEWGFVTVTGNGHIAIYFRNAGEERAKSVMTVVPGFEALANEGDSSSLDDQTGLVQAAISLGEGEAPYPFMKRTLVGVTNPTFPVDDSVAFIKLAKKLIIAVCCPRILGDAIGVYEATVDSNMENMTCRPRGRIPLTPANLDPSTSAPRLTDLRFIGPRCIVASVEGVQQGSTLLSWNESEVTVLDGPDNSNVQQDWVLSASHTYSHSSISTLSVVSRPDDAEKLVAVGLANGQYEMRSAGLVPTTLNAYHFGIEGPEVNMSGAGSVRGVCASPSGTNVAVWREGGEVDVAVAGAPSSKGEVVDTMIESTARKFVLALLNESDYDDLVSTVVNMLGSGPGASDIPERLLERFYELYDAAKSHSVPTTTQASDLRGIGVQVALYRRIPRKDQQYQTTYVGIQLMRILQTFVCSMTAPWEVIEAIDAKLTKEKITDEEVASLKAVNYRKDAFRELIPLATWTSDMFGVLFRQLYALFYTRIRSVSDDGVVAVPDPTDIRNASTLANPGLISLLFNSSHLKTLQRLAILIRAFRLAIGSHTQAQQSKAQSQQNFALRNTYERQAKFVGQLLTPMRIQFVLAFLQSFALHYEPSKTRQTDVETFVRGTVPRAVWSCLPKLKRAFEEFAPAVFLHGTFNNAPPMPDMWAVVMFGGNRSAWLEIGKGVEIGSMNSGLGKRNRDEEANVKEEVKVKVEDTPSVAAETRVANSTASISIADPASVSTNSLLPPSKLRRLTDIRSHFDVLTKRNLWRADSVRQCTRCLHFSVVSPLSGAAGQDEAGGSKEEEKKDEVFILPSGVSVPVGESCCACGGMWKVVM